MVRAALWCLATALGVAAIVHADEGWKRISERDGMIVEARPVEGTVRREVRVSTHDVLPPDAIMATLWRHEEYPKFVDFLEQVDVLRDEGDTKLVYERIHVPLGKERDTTLRITRARSESTGGWEVTSVAAPDEGPAPSPSYVRVRDSRSIWRLVPGAGGGTDLSYDIQTDAGGMLPGWIVARLQNTAAAKFVRAMLDRAHDRAR